MKEKKFPYRKTLREEAVQYSEVKNLYSHRKNLAMKHKIYSDLMLKFLSWLETSGAHNHEISWETDPIDRKWEYAWQEAIHMFLTEIKEEDFHIDVIGHAHTYTITIAYWDKTNPEVLKTKELIKENIKVRWEDKNIPYDVRQKYTELFKNLFNLTDKDSEFSHPKFKEFEEIIMSSYEKGMSYTQLYSKIHTGENSLLNILGLQNNVKKKTTKVKKKK